MQNLFEIIETGSIVLESGVAERSENVLTIRSDKTFCLCNFDQSQTICWTGTWVTHSDETNTITFAFVNEKSHGNTSKINVEIKSTFTFEQNPIDLGKGFGAGLVCRFDTQLLPRKIYSELGLFNEPTTLENNLTYYGFVTKPKSMDDDFM
jgi:hypothetical protein